MSATKETLRFETEAKQILDMMIYSVYSNKDIFLRELVSNASDALDKLHLRSLTDHSVSEYASDPFIRIIREEKDRVLSISDNGIGMGREEVIDYIGTIAKSGTKEFLEKLKDRREGDMTEMLIGQFGVGFYSAFMVADRVALLTRKAGEEKAWRWESSGDGTYTLEEAERPIPGTTVTLYLKAVDNENGMKDYTSEWTIREIVRKYSDFVAYPIKMQVEKSKGEEGGKVLEDETLNSMKAIWMRSESEVSDEEYNQFYRHISHDWQDPMGRVVFTTEGATELHGLLYIPSKAPQDMYMRDRSHGVSLYVKRVFIMEDCKDLLPEYLRFIRGVLDSEDLSLNVSREILQQDRQVRLIKKGSVRKILQYMKKLLSDDREKYISFWSEFGTVLKEGLLQDHANEEIIKKICLFSSTNSENDLTTLDEYVSRMKDGQEKIYYITGSSVDVLRSSPHLEVLKKKEYEVILLADPVDEIWIQGASFGDKELVSATKGTLEENKEEQEEAKKKIDRYKDLVSYVKDMLGDQVKDVRVSDRLTTSPACLVGDEDDMTPQMEQIMKSMGQEVPKVLRILEINPDHPVLLKMESIFESGDREDLNSFCEVLYGQALLAEGGTLADPAAFSLKLSDIMERALK